jgi:hypothetical protein
MTASVSRSGAGPMATRRCALVASFPATRDRGRMERRFRLTPQRPVAELRAEALAATRPVETGPRRQSDLVELSTLDSHDQVRHPLCHDEQLHQHADVHASAGVSAASQRMHCCGPIEHSRSRASAC